MERTENFFLIHNFNTVPLELVGYCKDYQVIDSSTDEDTIGRLKELGISFVHVENTGHNITSYFNYFADHYESLPEVICLLKGNMIGRHCSREFWERVYNNSYFTYLYEDRESRPIFSKPAAGSRQEERIASLVSENQYIEKNTSWYAESPNHPNRYFDDYDELLAFVYQEPVIPKYCLFSPGACYIVRREQIKKNSRTFYRNMNKLMNYGLEPNFPSEAHMVERMLPLIFESAYVVNGWMEKEQLFDEKLKERMDIMNRKQQENQKRFKRIRNLFH